MSTNGYSAHNGNGMNGNGHHHDDVRVNVRSSDEDHLSPNPVYGASDEQDIEDERKDASTQQKSPTSTATVSSPKSPASPSAASSPSSAVSPRKKSLLGADDDAAREEFLQIEKMEGFQASWFLEIRYWFLVLFSSGVLFLMNLWFFAKVVPIRHRRCALSEATHVLVTGRVHGAELVPVKQLGDDLVEASDYDTEENLKAARERRSSMDLLHHPGTKRGRMIIFRHMRYIFSPASQMFVIQLADSVPKRTEALGNECRHQNVAALKSKEIVERMKFGLTTEQCEDNLFVYGMNALILPVPSIIQLLYREVFHPFYVFQMYSIALWVYEVYYVFAGAVAVIAIVSIAQTVHETRRRMTELAALARFDCPVTVLRNSQFSTISSTQLVPGDIVQVTTGLLPCDLALLDGGAVVNESMLTGESVPVVKVNVQFPVNRLSDSVVPLGLDSRNTLFSATKILQLKPLTPDSKVLAMVIRTGFATTKGSLILSILYPKPSEFKFETQSYKFIALLFCLSLVGFALSVWQLKVVQNADIATVIIRGLDLITIVVPPSLPLALTVGTNFAIIWLRKELIFCISPSRISMAGKIRSFCFDKTGTLTAESLEFKGCFGPEFAEWSNDKAQAEFGLFQSPHSQRAQLQMGDEEANLRAVSSDETLVHSPSAIARTKANEVDTNRTVPLNIPIKIAMACCQSLAVMDGELIGDPLEQQTFEASNATMQDTGDLKGFQQLISIQITPESTLQYGVKEQFEFSSALQRMSVLCDDLQNNSHWAFVKGSPEMMETLCLPHTLPLNYRKVLSYFAHQGYRVIAIGHKQMDEVPRVEKAELRDIVEKGLIFLGLIILENKVKVESEPTLQILRDAAVRCVMVSGDNALTCTTVAKECKLVQPGTRVFQSTIVPDASRPGGQRIDWIDTDDDNLKLDPDTLKLPQHVLLESPDRELPFELAVTGSAFKMLQDMPDSHLDGSFFHRVVLNGQIFARMSPDQKASLVAEMQAMGIYTGMCGDGANDCGALKTAHVGVSLSESEASIAAPFTYQKPNISCIPILLAEGRSSLVTSFQLFRFMAMYSMIQFGACILTYFQGSVLGNYQYLYQDLWTVFPLTIAMGSTPANRALSVKRPSGNLLSVVNLSNLCVHILLALGFQVAVYQTIVTDKAHWKVLANPNHVATSYATTCLYYFSNFQYTIIAFLFAMGPPWKASIFRNWRFCFWCLVTISTSTSLLFSPTMDPQFFRTDDQEIPSVWKNKIAMFVCIFASVAALWHLILTPLLTKLYKASLRIGTITGLVFQRLKVIEGPKSKQYHRLRGEFETNWRA